VNDRLLNAREVGELLGLSANTVLDRKESGDLPGFNLYGKDRGPVRFWEGEIVALIEEWKLKGRGDGTRKAPANPERHRGQGHHRSSFPSPANPGAPSGEPADEENN
jgi:hypothetical protein